MGMGMGMKGNMPTFADFDLDGDGKIVEQEFNTAHSKKMSEMAAEGRQMKHVGDAPGFTGIDTNDDGEISEAEFAAHQAEHHKQMHESKHK
jgi:Ca2+-binding EF-hand superfamily protein